MAVGECVSADGSNAVCYNETFERHHAAKSTFVDRRYRQTADLRGDGQFFDVSCVAGNCQLRAAPFIDEAGRFVGIVSCIAMVQQRICRSAAECAVQLDISPKCIIADVGNVIRQKDMIERRTAAKSVVAYGSHTIRYRNANRALQGIEGPRADTAHDVTAKARRDIECGRFLSRVASNDDAIIAFDRLIFVSQIKEQSHCIALHAVAVLILDDTVELATVARGIHARRVCRRGDRGFVEFC